MAVVALKAKLWWELGEAFVNIHFNVVVLTAFFIRWFEGAAISWAGEGEKLVEAIAKATEGTVGAIDSSIGPTGFTAVTLVLANNLFRNFHKAIQDVTDGTTELTSRGVVGTWR